MIDLAAFANCRLRGGFVIVEAQLATERLTDPLGREAIAQTRSIGNNFHLLIQRDLSEKELSVTLYHEVLEAASVVSVNPPESVMDFNEGHFEAAGYAMHEKFGTASPENLSRMLQYYGFRE